jgi:hypothetical protein
MAELEQCRSTASNAKALSRELGASLEAAQLSANALQREKVVAKPPLLPISSAQKLCGHQGAF